MDPLRLKNGTAAVAWVALSSVTGIFAAEGHREARSQGQHYKLKQQHYNLMQHALKQYGVRNELERLQLLEDFYCVFTDVIKDDKTFSMIKKESVPLAANRNPRSESILRDCGGPRDEKGHVIEDSMFKLFNDSGGKVRKRSSECITGKGEESFGWRKKKGESNSLPECSAIFVEPLKWMQTVQEGYVWEKLYCMGCKSRLGSFNWTGMQCSCGAWMDEERILKIHYGANCVQLTIDDIDKCLLIDVFNDMCEEFANSGFDLPEYPGLHYCHNQKAFNLVDDGTLMKMFGNKDKEIDVWVHCLNEPSFIMNLARIVKPQQLMPKPQASTSALVPDSATGPYSASGPVVDVGPSSACTKPPSTSPSVAGPSKPCSSKPDNLKPGPPKPFVPIRRSPRLTHYVSPPKLNPSFTQPRRLPRLLEEISPDSPPHITLADDEFFHRNISESQLSSPPPRRSPRLLQELFSFLMVKLPNTTARVKGVFVPNSQSSQTTLEGESSRVLRPSAARGVQINDDESLHADDDNSSDSDGEYIPEAEQEVECDSDCEDHDPDLVQENLADLMQQNFVDGGWEPFRCAISLSSPLNASRPCTSPSSIHLKKPQSLHLKNAFLGLRVVVETFSFAIFGGLQKHRGLKNCRGHVEFEGNEHRELDMAS
uniref:Uncharacterized protein n=1 Tax=Chenopodium quinoa TaxID=63459 RepID=A0A803MXK4_CHEQI